MRPEEFDEMLRLRQWLDDFPQQATDGDWANYNKMREQADIELGRQ